MARTVIPVQPIPYQGSITDITYLAASVANGHSLVNDGRTFLVIKNGGAGVSTVTVDSVADQFGRVGDEVVAIAAGKDAVLGPFLPQIWNQAGSALVNIDLDVDTSVEIAAFQVPAGK